MPVRRIVLAISGASGTPYAKRLFDILLESGAKIDVVLSKTGERIWSDETGESLSYFERPNSALHKDNNLFVNIASGSSHWDSIVVIPASMGTIGRIANGISDSLITRSADVALKERRKLILVSRETPLSLIHLENMTKITRAGGIILPASPAFYQKPQTIDDMVDFVVGRVLDQLGINQTIVPEWDYSPE
ncbi:MAG: flavin prenyltransferase UbiX [Nitrospinota bacterium]|nr:UbiX family flavin prenyltransferase [Nitrospinota bacterium]